MNEVTNYDIAYGRDASDLVEAVNDMIQKGWQPHGNMLMHDDDAHLGHCYQPMVKYINRNADTF